MKKSILFFSLLIGPLCFSQIKGKVTYHVSMNKTDIELPYENPDNSEARNQALEMIHESQPVESYLIFNDSISLYYNQEKDDMPIWDNNDGIISITPSGLNMTWFMAGGGNVYYTDWSKNFNISTFNAMGEEKRIIKNFIEWNITNETKNILGYVCKRAISKTNDKHVAWFTEDIHVKHGPRGFNNLPGLILEVRSNKFYFVATKLEMNHPEVNVIVAPKDGELITYEDFKKKYSRF